MKLRRRSSWAIVPMMLVVGCTSTRISDSIDGVGKMSAQVQTERKYHIEKMLRRNMIGDGAIPGGDSSASISEIEVLEQMSPKVFDRNGIPCSVVSEVKCESGRTAPNYAWRVLCGCTLFVLPSKWEETYVYTYRVRSRLFPREGNFRIRRRCETWMSSIGLNYLMSFSQDERTAYCWDVEASAQGGRQAESDGIASSLRLLEQESGVRKETRPIGKQIGE